MKKYVVRVDDQFVEDYGLDGQVWTTVVDTLELTGDVDKAFIFYEGSELLDVELWRLYFREDVEVDLLEVRTVIV